MISTLAMLKLSLFDPDSFHELNDKTNIFANDIFHALTKAEELFLHQIN